MRKRPRRVTFHVAIKHHAGYGALLGSAVSSTGHSGHRVLPPAPPLFDSVIAVDRAAADGGEMCLMYLMCGVGCVGAVPRALTRALSYQSNVVFGYSVYFSPKTLFTDILLVV
jgi:hypothetical protein